MVSALTIVASWPPLDRAKAKEALWKDLSDEQRGALRRWEADDETLLQAALALCPDIRETQTGELYVPPVLFVDALKQLRHRLPVGVSVDELRAHIDTELAGVADPLDLDAELATVGLAHRDGRIVSAIDKPEPAPISVKVDPSLPRQTVGPRGEIDVSVLVAAADLGGFRVAALPPRRHHVLCERLRDALTDALGEERVRFVDVDRVVIETLQEADLWNDALFYERKAQPRWSWAHKEIISGLQAAVFADGAATTGVITVLGRPSLLGTLDLMPWLSGLYDRTRRGKDGLIVLAVPGGIHDGRVRLNEHHNLAYTPDMAALVLRSDERAA